MSIRRFVALCALLGSTLLFRPAGTAHAAGDWLPIDSSDLKMTNEPLAPGAKAIYLYRQVDRDDAANAGTEANYLRIKILTEEGRALGNIEIAFVTEYMTVSNIRARTIRLDGSVVNFDGKVYEKTIVKGRGVKYLAKTFTMPEVCVGCIIEYRFNYDFSNKWIVEKHPHTCIGSTTRSWASSCRKM